ncbi:NADPH-dependent codeinone reductase 1-4-like [Carex rostrata]
MTSEKIPKLTLNNGHVMPVLGMGTTEYPAVQVSEKMISAYLDAIAVGYRHFDTASHYKTEKPLGEAIHEAIKLGLIGSREEMFITSIQSSLSPNSDHGFLKRKKLCWVIGSRIALRWLLEQGVSMAVKSFNKERLQQNLEIFDWEFTEEERLKISTIPQKNKGGIELILTKEESLNSINISNLEIHEV